MHRLEDLLQLIQGGAAVFHPVCDGKLGPRPPHPSTQSLAPMLATCANFYDPVEANVVQARLVAEGIPATVADGHMINSNWPLSVALGGVRLQVPEEFLADANAVLERYFSGAFSADVDAETGCEPQSCPKCSGRSLKRLVPASQKALALGVYLASGATFPTRESLLRCRDCGKQWRDVA